MFPPFLPSQHPCEVAMEHPHIASELMSSAVSCFCCSTYCSICPQCPKSRKRLSELINKAIQYTLKVRILLLIFAIPWLSQMILRNKEELRSPIIIQILKNHEEKDDSKDHPVDKLAFSKETTLACYFISLILSFFIY